MSVLPVGTVLDRTFDYQPKLHPANLNFLISAASQQSYASISTLWKRPRWWTGGQILDQGQEGACVPHGVEGEALASPVRVKVGTPERTQALAFEGYDWCRRNDEYPGEDYDGTSVRAGMLWGRKMGWWDSFYWAKNMNDLRVGLETGPVVIGVTWKSGMYSTRPSGLVVVNGDVVGGHCLLITGYSPNYNGTGPRFRWRNSWGRGYGNNGNGYVTPADLNSVLFEEGNEAAVATGRNYGQAV